MQMCEMQNITMFRDYDSYDIRLPYILFESVRCLCPLNLKLAFSMFLRGLESVCLCLFIYSTYTYEMKEVHLKSPGINLDESIFNSAELNATFSHDPVVCYIAHFTDLSDVGILFRFIGVKQDFVNV